MGGRSRWVGTGCTRGCVLISPSSFLSNPFVICPKTFRAQDAPNSRAKKRDSLRLRCNHPFNATRTLTTSTKSDVFI